MENEKLNFEEDLSIDFYNLHNEWARQAGLMAKYSKFAARHKEEMDKAEELIKTTRSEIIKRVRERNPKATAQAIEADYRDDREHREAKQSFIDAEYNYNMAQAAVSSIHQKKYALENLVKLLGMDYFSIPKEDVKAPTSMASEIQDEKNARSRSVRGRRRRG